MKIEEAKVIQVLFIKYVKGNGTEKNPTRSVIQYRDLNGDLITELDDYELTNISASSEVSS